MLKQSAKLSPAGKPGGLPLSAEQEHFVTSAIQSASLLGNPGCGKTRSIIEFLNHKHRSALRLRADGFVVVTFSKMAQLDFLVKGKASACGKLYSTKNVRTIHSLAYALYRVATGSTSKFLNTIVLSTSKLLESHLSHGADKATIDLSQWENCRVFIVDEAQDVSASQYSFIKLLAAAVGAAVIMVGDPNQNIYQFQGGSDRFLMTHPGEKFFLTTNYRSTPAIVTMLNELRPHKNLPPMTYPDDPAAVEPETRPVLFGGKPCEIEQYIVDTVASAIASGVDASDIAVIGSVRKSREGYLAIGLSSAVHALHAAGIPFLEHYSDGGKTGGNCAMKKSAKAGHVNLLTCHGSKGLEFHTTLVINYHMNTFMRRPTEEDYHEHKYLWYVALSRAKENMHICVNTAKKIQPSFAHAGMAFVQAAGASIPITPLSKVKFAEYSKPAVYHVKDVVTDNKHFSESVYFKIQQLSPVTRQEYSIQTDNIHQSQGAYTMAPEGTAQAASNRVHLTDLAELSNMQSHATLYGEIMELVLQAEIVMQTSIRNSEELASEGHSQRRRAAADFLKQTAKSFEDTIVLDSKYERALNALQACGIYMGNTIMYRTASMHFPKSSGDRRDVLRMVIDTCTARTLAGGELEHATCRLVVSNNAQVFDRMHLIHIADAAVSKMDTLDTIEQHAVDRLLFDGLFDMVMYRYAFANERKSWVGLSEIYWKEYKDELFTYYENARAAATALLTVGHDFAFEQTLAHPLLPLVGRVDALFAPLEEKGHMEGRSQILEIKFTGQITEEHIAQCMVYMLQASKGERMSTWLVNLKSLQVFRLTLVEQHRWTVQKILAQALGVEHVRPVFVLDLETNSRQSSKDFPEIHANEIEIIDHHVYEMATGSVVSTGLVQNRWPVTNAHIHGITDHMIATLPAITQGQLARVFRDMVVESSYPVFVAHNGNGFDFKVLKELSLVPTNRGDDGWEASDITWLDSINVLRSFVKLATADYTPPHSMKLEHMYKTFIDQDYVQTHRAAEDVDMMLALFKHFGLDQAKLLECVD